MDMHARPHTPQLSAESMVRSSHPSSLTSLQLPKPAWHWNWQRPTLQLGTTFGKSQTCPHPPQLFLSFSVSRHLPSQQVRPF
jgi:hypothetical protein